MRNKIKDYRISEILYYELVVCGNDFIHGWSSQLEKFILVKVKELLKNNEKLLKINKERNLHSLRPSEDWLCIYLRGVVEDSLDRVLLKGNNNNDQKLYVLIDLLIEWDCDVRIQLFTLADIRVFNSPITTEA